MTSQSTRFPPYASSNSRDVPSQQLASNTFSTSNWQQNGIWGNRIASTIGNRDAPASLRNGGQDENFIANHQTSSNAFTTAPDSTDVWGHSARSWNNTDATNSRKTSTSPSPARGRDDASYLAAIGPAPNFGGARSKATGSSADSNVSMPFHRPSTLRDIVADSDQDANGPSAYAPFGFDSETSSARGRSSQDASNVFSAPSAAVSVSGSSVSTSAATPAPGSTSAATGSALPSLGSYSTLPSHQGHSHRQSLQTSTSFPSPAAPANSLPYHRNSQTEDQSALAFADMLRHNLNIDDRSESALGGNFGPGLSTYPQSSSSGSFQFNPGSQPWEAAIAASNTARSNGFSAYTADDRPTDSITAAAIAAARTSMVGLDRGPTPVGGSYRHINVARSLGTPSTNGGPWSRPSSRDPRLSGFSENALGLRGLQQRPSSNIMYSEQQQPIGASVGGQNFFANNLNPYFYSPSFRSPIQMSPLGIPVNTSLIQPPHMQQQLNSRDKDPARGFRSPLLEEFRSSKTNRKYELRDIYDHIVEFSGDQHGSRFIQGKLETANSDEKEHVFREISANTLVLMKDVFGNYVVQKFFEHGSQVQKKYLAEQMKGKIVDLSTQTYACRVVQKALQHILVEQQVELAQELEVEIISVIKDQNGNHVVQKVIELVPREHISFIMDAFRGKVRELSSHNFGCRVVQRMLEHGSPEDKTTILSELHENTQDLIMDQFGNYVAQHVIQFGKPKDRAMMIGKVLDQLVPMSKHKFASNVVEKCIEYGSPDDRRRIREELNRIGNDGQPVLQSMIKDQYGNYVIQKLLKQLKNEEQDLFVESLSTQLGLLRRSSTGRQNAAIERLAVAIDELPKKSTSSQSQLPLDQASTPSLTNTPNTPESSNPPSVSAGPAGTPIGTRAKGDVQTSESIDLDDDSSTETPTIQLSA